MNKTKGEEKKLVSPCIECDKGEDPRDRCYRTCTEYEIYVSQWEERRLKGVY